VGLEGEHHPRFLPDDQAYRGLEGGQGADLSRLSAWRCRTSSAFCCRSAAMARINRRKNDHLVSSSSCTGGGGKGVMTVSPTRWGYRCRPPTAELGQPCMKRLTVFATPPQSRTSWSGLAGGRWRCSGDNRQASSGHEGGSRTRTEARRGLERAPPLGRTWAASQCL
jgi:hypothetical protein